MATAILANRRSLPTLPTSCFGLDAPTWEIRYIGDPLPDDRTIIRRIPAFSAGWAWRQFCELYFGALKPSPSDYVVSLAESEVGRRPIPVEPARRAIATESLESCNCYLEVPAGQPMPNYCPVHDGDYESWLVANNVD